jgi:plasmid maintenance system antidote protein VapI
LQELNLTKDQILAFTEVAAISNGEYDSKLNETDLAIKFGINVAEIEILTEARILEETLDLSNLEGTQLAKVMGISDEQIRQMVSIQNGNFTAMMDSGVLKQLGFEREQQVLEGVFKLAAKKDMQFNLLQAAATAMSAHDLYQDRMANANSLTDQADALTALVNVGLTESGSGLSQDQIKAITLMMDLMSGQK